MEVRITPSVNLKIPGKRSAHLALAAGIQDRPAQADEYCQQAAKLCDVAQYQAELPSVLYTWMQLHFRRRDFESAKQFGERSIPLFKANGDRKSQAFVLAALLRVYLELKEYELAEASGRQSLAIFQELRDDWSAVQLMRDLGKLLLRVNRPVEARNSWAKALEIAQALEHPLTEEIRGLRNDLEGVE